MNSTIRVISGDWNILPVGDIKNNWSYFRLETTLSVEINEIADIIFVSRREILALNNLKFQCYSKFHTFQLSKTGIQTITCHISWCHQNIQCIFNVYTESLLKNRNCQF